jgi:phenylpropionate dioxygenase-like ring-hydroxylating dioxygenase large terminal subunit
VAVNWPIDQWYAAGWDYEIDRQPLARIICGEPVMLYRRFDRSVVAMRDACPHRMLPLSMGIKEGDNIRCRYHGLLIDSAGRGIEMPLRGDPVARTTCGQTYPVVERHRFAWIWIGDAEKADAALIPNFWPCSDPAWTFDGGYYHIACDYRLGIDNLMDLTHETHVHAGSIGQPELMATPMETTSAGNEVFVKRWMPDIDAPPFWRNALRQDGSVDRWQICQFIAPSFGDHRRRCGTGGRGCDDRVSRSRRARLRHRCADAGKPNLQPLLLGHGPQLRHRRYRLYRSVQGAAGRGLPGGSRDTGGTADLDRAQS